MHCPHQFNCRFNIQFVLAIYGLKIFKVIVKFLSSNLKPLSKINKIITIIYLVSCFLHAISMQHLTVIHFFYDKKLGRRGGLMVSPLVSGSSGLGSSPGREHCVVFLGKSLKDVRTNCFCVSFCARKFTRHVMRESVRWAIKWANDRADGHCYSFPGFNDLGRTVTPVFLLMYHFLYQFSAFSEKWRKSID